MAQPQGGYTPVQKWLQIYTEDCVYKAIGKMYTREKASCVVQMITDGQGIELIDDIKKYNSNSGAIDRKALLFALALCAKSHSQDLKSKAGEAMLDVCKTPRDLFTYLRFLKNLSTSKGFGSSIRKSVQKWYNREDPVQFVKLVTQYVSYDSWNHKDVLRMIHPSGNSDSTSLILKYLVQGLEETKKEFKKPDASEEILSLLGVAEDIHRVKHSTDEHEAARLVEKHSLKIEHVPTKFLHSKEILDALISSMQMSEILENLHYFAISGYLEDSYKGCKDIIDMVKNEASLKEQNVQPIEVLVATQRYEHGIGKGGKKITWKVNPAVVNALKSAFESCLKSNVKATNKRYLIAARVGSNKKKTHCRGCVTLSSLKATAAMAVSLAKKEDKVDFIYFTDKATQITLSADIQIQNLCDELASQALIAETLLEEQNELLQSAEGEEAIKPKLSEPCDMSCPIKWALDNKKKIDVFLTIVDTRDSGTVKVSETLQQYRREMKLPNTKHICMSLTFVSPTFAKAEVGGMLDISGFDKNVPKIINKFVEEF